MCDDQDDVPRHTIGLTEAEARLRLLAVAFETAKHNQAIVYDGSRWIMKRQFAADILLVLNELNGLKQFDPR